MNKENILLVAAAIRKHAANFSLQTYAAKEYGTAGETHLGSHIAKEPDCDTVACICGWTNTVQNRTHGTKYNFADSDTATQFLGLSWSFGRNLFVPRPDCDSQPRHPWEQAKTLNILPPEKSPYDATAEEAASLLEAIADGRIELY